jgi:hypothetical protein
MSDTPRTVEFLSKNSSYMEKRAFMMQLERELTEANRRACEYYLTDESVIVMESPEAVREARKKAAKRMIDMERELTAVTEQRDKLAAALKSLCKIIIYEVPRDITDLLKQSGAAIAAVEGGSHEHRTN